MTGGTSDGLTDSHGFKFTGAVDRVSELHAGGESPAPRAAIVELEVMICRSWIRAFLSINKQSLILSID